MATVFAYNWNNGPIGPGFFLMIAPLEAVAVREPSRGGGGWTDKITLEHMIDDSRKRRRREVEALALLMLLQHCQGVM